LLGKDVVREVLNSKLNYTTHVPDMAFEHDLKYNDALKIIQSLKDLAYKNNVFFGIKLSNTLECTNHKNIFDKENKMMYMSGKALHPISVMLARKITSDFDETLDISFSAGADCFNISDLIASDLKPVTVCSDILKPGGYARLHQYIQELNKDFAEIQAENIDDFISKKNGGVAINSFLDTYADNVLDNEMYKKTSRKEPSIKINRPLPVFDCITAPCVCTCPTNQDIPQYLYHTARGEFDKAYEVILNTNPLPSILGNVCDHTCQTKCTRINYDNPLLIREVKRFISETPENLSMLRDSIKKNGLQVAIIGAGPAGLSCAYFLAIAGYEVTIFEKSNNPGGMVSEVIPKFRIGTKALVRDIDRIESLGVKIKYNTNISNSFFQEIRLAFNYIFIAVGAQGAKKMKLEGSNSKGVLDPLTFLTLAKKGIKTDIGKKIAVIGAGNTAMDVARTALRLVGNQGKVQIVYRRTITEMPANPEEIDDLLAEGIDIIELTAPEKIVSDNNGQVASLVCSKMRLSEKDASGRATPIKIEGSEFSIPFDTIIPALGQEILIDFVDISLLKTRDNSMETLIDKVFIGGDALNGGASVVHAVADGRKVAAEIIQMSELSEMKSSNNLKKISLTEIKIKRANRVYGEKAPKLSDSKIGFDLSSSSMSTSQAITEANRCLYCDEICNVCVTVCPNLANYAFKVKPFDIILTSVKKEDYRTIVTDDEFFSIKQSIQIVNFPNWCNHCGNCETFCPTNSAPFKEKPKMFLSKMSWDYAKAGYFLEMNDDYYTLYYKNGMDLHMLTFDNEKYTYSGAGVEAKFTKEDFRLMRIHFLDRKIRNFSVRKAGEMKVLLDGMKDFIFDTDEFKD